MDPQTESETGKVNLNEASGEKAESRLEIRDFETRGSFHEFDPEKQGLTGLAGEFWAERNTTFGENPVPLPEGHTIRHVILVPLSPNAHGYNPIKSYYVRAGVPEDLGHAGDTIDGDHNGYGLGFVSATVTLTDEGEPLFKGKILTFTKDQK